MQDEKSLDNNFSCVDGVDRPYLSHVSQKELARFTHCLDMNTEVKDNAQFKGISDRQDGGVVYSD